MGRWTAVVLAACLLVAVALPRTTPACSPSFFAETLMLQLDRRLVDGEEVDSLPPRIQGRLTSHGNLEVVSLSSGLEGQWANLEFQR